MKTLLFSILLISLCFTKAIGQNHVPVAGRDTVTSFLGFPVYVTRSFLLQNDYDPDGDSIHIIFVSGWSQINDTMWTRTMPTYVSEVKPYDSCMSFGFYKISDDSAFTYGSIILMVKGFNHYDYIDKNNIKTLISPFGNHFWNLDSCQFEVPKGTGKKAVFSECIWIGGMDAGDTLHLAAERYRQYGSDYFAGPISFLADTSYDLRYRRVWKINKSDIIFHMNNWNQPGYLPIEVIQSWPGNGDTTLGQSFLLAPFYDLNNNDVYEPAIGDYPIIRGDQAIFFIFNDVRFMHTESFAYPLGIEVHGMAYEYDQPDDSTLFNTLFIHYDIINRSTLDYKNCYAGIFSDFDLGFANDDYVGCDVQNGLMFDYNGDNQDGTGQSWAYGEHPPAIGLKIIGGPFLDADQLDNPSDDCQQSLNGLNFGDGITDNERYGMTNFVYFNDGNSGVPPYMWDPVFPSEYYGMMRSIWKDGTHLLYGNNGHLMTGSLGPECNYMFPGDSDTLCNWGTTGVLPNGGFNQNGKYWTDSTAGNPPQDRRELASAGPFEFKAGSTVPFDYCYVFARDYTGDNNSSLNLLRTRIESKKSEWNALISLPSSYLYLKEPDKEFEIHIYPNPFQDQTNIVVDRCSPSTYSLYNITGSLIKKGFFNPGNNLVDFSILPTGVYFLKCGTSTYKLIHIY